jgi:serine/threonine protein kinase
VTTRYYRAPELYLNFESNYTAAVDMWSLGCIIAEFFNKTVFVKAGTTEEYLEFLISFLGMPSQEIQANEIRNKNFLKYMQKRDPHIKRKTLKELIPTAPPQALDLISKLLSFDPSQRISALEVLKHPFLEELYDPKNDDQIQEGELINFYDFEFEQFSINKDILRELILDEIIMANSKEARTINSQLRKKYKTGVLEIIYERKDQEKREEAKKPAKSLNVDMSAISKEPEVIDANNGEYSASTVDESPEKNESPMKNMELPSKFNFAAQG